MPDNLQSPIPKVTHVPAYAKTLIGIGIVIVVLLCVITYSVLTHNATISSSLPTAQSGQTSTAPNKQSSQMSEDSDTTASAAAKPSAVPEYLHFSELGDDQMQKSWLAKYISTQLQSCAPAGTYNWPTAVIAIHNSSTSLVMIAISVGFKNSAGVFFTIGIRVPEVPADSTVLSTVEAGHSSDGPFQCEIINKHIEVMTKGS